MRKVFEALPAAIQKQILLRGGFGVLFLIITIALVIISGDIYIILPAAVMLLFCLATAFLLFRRGVTKDYVVVRGVCEETGKTLLTRRIKTILIKTDQHTVQVSPWNRPRRITAGTRIDLYVATSTPVYEKDGVQVIPSYLAMEVKGAAENDDQG